jgi:hypothetical protein
LHKVKVSLEAIEMSSVIWVVLRDVGDSRSWLLDVVTTEQLFYIGLLKLVNVGILVD